MDLETTRPVEDIVPIARGTDAADVALAVYARLIDDLEHLEPDAWEAATECSRWDVAAMVGHLIGAGKACATVRELVRQQWWGRRHADEFEGNALDAFNELQARDHAALSPGERIIALRRIAPAAVRGRMRVPRPLRRVTLPMDQGGSTAPGMPPTFSLGHLMDVIYTRDTWLHTIDIARATGAPYEPDPGVDGRVVEDVVAEWSRRHDRPLTLVLTGPAGGRFRQGRGGGRLQLDAIEYCRILSGRSDPESSLVEIDVDAPDTIDLLHTKVLF